MILYTGWALAFNTGTWFNDVAELIWLKMNGGIMWLCQWTVRSHRRQRQTSPWLVYRQLAPKHGDNYFDPMNVLIYTSIRPTTNKNFPFLITLVSCLKQHLGGRWFQSNEEVETAVRRWSRCKSQPCDYSVNRLGTYTTLSQTKHDNTCYMLRSLPSAHTHTNFV